MNYQLKCLEMTRTFNGRRAALLLGTALAATLTPQVALAGTVTVTPPTPPATSTSSASVDASIDAVAATDADVKVDVQSGAVVLGGGAIGYSAAPAAGDGKLDFTNAGKIGSIDTAGAVTDATGVQFFGLATAAGNTATLVNSGLITNGFIAPNFGGAVTMTNSGTVYGTAGASSFADVTVTNTASGAVRNGDLIGIALATAKSTPPADFVTTTRTGGNATVTSEGAVVSVDGATRGNVQAIAQAGDATVTVNNIAGFVSASTGAVVKNVTGGEALVPGKSVTTFQNDVTNGGGIAKIVIGSSGDVTAANASGAGGATVTIDGKVANGAGASSSVSDSTFLNTHELNAGGITTKIVSTSSSTAAGKAASIAVNSGASVNLNASSNVSGSGASTTTVDGTVGGNASATSLGIAQTNSQQQTFDGATPVNSLLTQQSKTTRVVNGGTAATSVGTSGWVKANATANADGGASVTNAGRVGGNVFVTSQRTITALSQSDQAFTTTGSSSANTTTVQTVGSTAAFTNASTGLVEGVVSINSVGNATVTNNGQVRGTTSVTSSGQLNTNSSSSSNDSKTVVGTPPALDVTTTVVSNSSSGSNTAIGGSVTGTYAGVNGTLNFAPASAGSISQSANMASTATISGVVFGDVSSTAGTGANTTFASASDTTTVLDTAGDGTFNSSSSNASSSKSTAGGASAVTVSGRVGIGNGGGSAFVTSAGTDSASLIVSGTVEGGANVSASSNSSSSKGSTVYAQSVKAFTPTTLSVTESSSSQSAESAGAASLDLQGRGAIVGSTNVTGVSSASAKLASGASIGSSVSSANLTVQATGFDSSSSSDRSYVRDAKTGVVTASTLDKSSSGAAAASGNASVDVAGTVNGSITVNAARGNATVLLTGVSKGSVSAQSSGSVSTSSNQTDYSGKAAAGAGTSFFGNALPAVTKTTSTLSNTQTAGRGDVTVDTAASLQALGAIGVGGSVTARGLAGSTVTVTAGSKISGGVSANSLGANTASTDVTTFGSQTDRTLDQSTTNVGGAALVANAGSIGSSVSATGRSSATVTNSGTISGNVSANTLAVDTVSKLVDTNITNAALRKAVTTTTNTAVGGASKVENAAGGVIVGSVSLAGATGSVTNAGAINGSINLGASVQNSTSVKTDTAFSTATTTTLPATAFTQTYTVDQNGTSRGVNVTGALSGSSKTSDITATVNLNSGSATLGSIVAQQSSAGANLTNTTVNLNGSGFLGADLVFNSTPAGNPGASPVLVLSSAARSAGFGTGPVAVQIVGVNTVNKTGAGTFVINGANYVAPAAAGLNPTWTMDVGSFNINGGEVQLATPAGAGAQFGIKGNVTNAATLVIGRRVPTSVQAVGDSLVSSGPETINGISVRQTGNFTSTGTIVVGVNPSLTRFGNLSLGTSGSATEVLGPVTSGVVVPYFTTPAKAGNANVPSRWDVTGNLSLGGTIVTDINRNSIFSTGDGYTLFSYTGAGTVTATVNPSLTSQFVSFGLTHDTAAKTVAIAATRKSYASAASNPNAVAAAVALDSAIPVIVGKIKTDATGGAGFTSVADLGRTQDIANIVSGLDWRLNGAQATQVFNELSSAEIYASLANLRQNAAFDDAVSGLASHRSVGQELGTRLWMSPFGSFTKFDADANGASGLKVDSYGGAIGFDVAYNADGAFGFGFGYAQHDTNARDTAEKATSKTYTIGAYWTQGFGPIYANAQFAYGFSNFDTQRSLSVLARTITGEFKGNEVGAQAEVGYDFKAGGNFVVTPYGRLAVRHWSLDSFVEEGGAGIGLSVDKASKSVFEPTLGVKLATLLGDAEGFAVRPYVNAAYTFQGDIGATRTVSYLGGGNSFVLGGVNPDGFGTIEGGIDATVSNKIGLFVGAGYSFGGQQSVGRVRGGISFRF